MDLFQDLSWELSVLARSVSYKNLSGASGHVGLSQPQLSRIVSRLEGALDVVLLDRTSRRSSGWTPAAFRVAELYSKASRHLQTDLQKLLGASQLKEVRIGALEGLMHAAMAFARHLFEAMGAQVVELDIFDLDMLEENFLKESLEFILTVREPGRRKHHLIRTLGYQRLEEFGAQKDFRVVSPFEYGSKTKSKEKSKTLISNSLAVRRHWLEHIGGQGFVPSTIHKTALSGQHEVLLIGSSQLSHSFWKKASHFDF
jgi:hypothetical protein